MAVKRFTRVTCAASLLLAELAPTAQALDTPDDFNPDSVPVGSDQHPKTLAYDASNAPPSAARPERVTVVETTRIAPPPAPEPITAMRSTTPPPIAQPERFTPQPVVPKPEPQATRTKDIVTSTRAQDLGAPQAIALPVVSPDARTRKADAGQLAASPNAQPKLTSLTTQSVPAPALDSALSDRDGVTQTKALRPETVSKPTFVAATVPIAPVPAAVTPGPIAPTETPIAATAPIISPKVGGTFTSGPGVGYNSSFTGIKGFIPIAQRPGQNITYAEGQAFVNTGDGKPGANLVIGHRFYDPKGDRIYGGYLAYDHRSTSKNGFNQIGLGLETLGKTWDARINAYLPVGDTRQLVSENSSTTTTLGTPFFQSNFLAANRTIQQQIDRKFEAAAAGVDAEAGGKITSLGQFGELRGYGGLYYFGAPGGDGTVGVRGRLEARPTDDLQVGVAVSSDNNYGTTVALSVGVMFPTNRSSVNRDRSANPLLARLGDPVNRNANIVLDRQRETQRTTTQDVALLNNPATGQPWRFRHAVPGVGTGDGTFENPTGTVAAALAIAQPDDIVYVQPGTNPGIPAFTIPDRVQVLSTGPVQRIDTVQLGNIALPLSGAGVLPTVQDTITLGNSTTLSGFAISSGRGPGIVGNNISQVTIRDNAIANTGLEGILLNNVQGPVTITDNTIQQARSSGVVLTNTQGQVDLLLARNQITNNGAATGGDGVSIALINNATGTATLTNNTLTNNGAIAGTGSGVNMQLANAANGTFNVTDNTITGNQENGVTIDVESTARGTFNITRNTLSNNQQQGAAIQLSDSGQAQITMDGNTISSNQQFGILALGNNLSNSTLNITNNAIGSNQADGILLQTFDQARMTANLVNNTILNNLSTGISMTALDTSQLRFLAEANTIANNGFAGISIASFPGSTVFGALRGNTLTGNPLSDVDALTFGAGSNVCLQARNNVIGTLTLDDLSVLGLIQVEDGTNLGTNNTITTANLGSWSGTSIPAGSCGF